MLANVLPRQSVSSAISWSIRSDGFIGSSCLEFLSLDSPRQRFVAYILGLSWACVLRAEQVSLLYDTRHPEHLLLHLTKRSHGCQRVHIVPPLHDLSALDGNDRDEPVIV